MASGGHLRLTAFAPGSGATIWSKAASTSATAPGEAPALAVTAGKVIYFRAVNGQVAELAASDAGTGRELWRSRPGAFTSWPGFCPGETTAICVTGVIVGQRPHGTELRFDARSGKLLGSLLLSPLPAARGLADGLFDPAERNPEYLVAANGTRVVWREPLAKVFTLSGASTDWGWYFDRIDHLGLFVGNPGWTPTSRSQTTAVLDLSRAMTAGFRISDGTTVWRNRGTTYICNYLPCPGSAQGGAITSSPTEGPSVGVRLRNIGTLNSSLSGNSLPVASSKATVTLEGFDLRSGRTRWSFDAGHDPGLIAETLLPPQAGSASILLYDHTHRLVRLDLRDGSHHAVAATTIGWCRSPISYQEQLPYQTGGGVSATTYYGQNAAFPCNSAQRRVAVPSRVPAFVAAIGARARDLAVWADTTRLVAAPFAS